MTKNEKFKVFLIFIALITITSVISVLSSKILWLYGITRFWRILEYCGDWLLWGLLTYIAWGTIFCNPDFDKDFKEMDASRKKK